MYYWLKRHLREIFDKRRVKWWGQQLSYGFDVRDTWGLNYTAAKWILPRLKMFKEVNICYPLDLTVEKWDEYLDSMIYSFQNFVDEQDDWDEWEKRQSIENNQKVQEGLELFGRYYRDLWW